jgi:hypothetical protein
MKQEITFQACARNDHSVVSALVGRTRVHVVSDKSEMICGTARPRESVELQLHECQLQSLGEICRRCATILAGGAA